MPIWSRDVLDAPHTIREFEQLDFEMYEHVRFSGAPQRVRALTGAPPACGTQSVGTRMGGGLETAQAGSREPA